VFRFTSFHFFSLFPLPSIFSEGLRPLFHAPKRGSLSFLHFFFFSSSLLLSFLGLFPRRIDLRNQISFPSPSKSFFQWKTLPLCRHQVRGCLLLCRSACWTVRSPPPELFCGLDGRGPPSFLFENPGWGFGNRSSPPYEIKLGLLSRNFCGATLEKYLPVDGVILS